MQHANTSVPTVQPELDVCRFITWGFCCQLRWLFSQHTKPDGFRFLKIQASAMKDCESTSKIEPLPPPQDAAAKIAYSLEMLVGLPDDMKGAPDLPSPHISFQSSAKRMQWWRYSQETKSCSFLTMSNPVHWAFNWLVFDQQFKLFKMFVLKSFLVSSIATDLAGKFVWGSQCSLRWMVMQTTDSTDRLRERSPKDR